MEVNRVLHLLVLVDLAVVVTVIVLLPEQLLQVLAVVVTVTLQLLVQVVVE